MKSDYLSSAISNSPVLLNSGGAHFTVGEMKASLTPVGWVVLILLIVFAFWLIVSAVRFLVKNKTLK